MKMFFFFSKNSLDFSPKELKHEVVQDIIMPYICVNYNKNQSINEGTTGWRPVVAVFCNIFVSCYRYIMVSDSMIWLNKLGVR